MVAARVLRSSASVQTETVTAPEFGLGPRVLSFAQTRAIKAAMETFIEEDLAFGMKRSARRWCVRCKADRPGAGFIGYEGGDLSNACATDYELARACGAVSCAEEFISHCRNM